MIVFHAGQVILFADVLRAHQAGSASEAAFASCHGGRVRWPPVGFEPSDTCKT